MGCAESFLVLILTFFRGEEERVLRCGVSLFRTPTGLVRSPRLSDIVSQNPFVQNCCRLTFFFFLRPTNAAIFFPVAPGVAAAIGMIPREHDEDAV